MKKSEWAPGALEQFHEQSIDLYDYITCIRGDGSYYGNGGVKCVKGSPATKKDLAAEKKKAKAGDPAAAKKVKQMEKTGVAAPAPKVPKAPKGAAKSGGGSAPTASKSSEKSQADKIAAIKEKKAAYTKATKAGQTAKAKKLKGELDAMRKDAEKTAKPKPKAAPKKALSEAEAAKQLKTKQNEYKKAINTKPRDFAKEARLRKEVDSLTKAAKPKAERDNEKTLKDMKKRSAKQPEKTNPSPEARAALLKYARNQPDPPAYKEINGCARGKRCTKETKQDIENLDKAIKEWPANTSGGSHYRGFNASKAQLASLGSLKPGDSISDGGFGSYSRNPYTAQNFSAGNGKRVIIESRSTSLRGIERNATYKSEQEAILPRNTSQTVREVRESGDFLFITVD